MADPKSQLPVTGNVKLIDTDGHELNVNANGSINSVVSGTVSVTSSQVADLKNVSVVNFPASQAVTGNFLTDVQLRAAPVVISGTVSTTIAGVSTAAKQDIGNASLASIDTKLTHPLAIRALTFADKVDVSGSSVSVTNFPSSYPVTGNFLTDAQLRLTAVAVSLATIPLATDAARESKQDAGNAYLASIDLKLTGPISVQGPLTDAQLRASAVPVSGTLAISNFPTTQNVAVTSSVLPTGASTSALQTSGNSLLSSINSFASSIDTKLTAPVSVSGPLTNTQLRAVPVPVSGTVLANLGSIGDAATELTLASIDSKVPTGLTVKAASTPAVSTDRALVVTLSPNNPIVVSAITGSVEISNDVGNPIPISAASLPLPTGAATSALQTTGNASLASIDSKLTNPMPVTATNLNIRDLTFTRDKVDVSTSVVALDAATITQLRNIDVTVSNEVEIKNDAGNPVPVTGTINVGNFPTTQNVAVTSSVLPTGASTSALQTTGNASLASIDTKLSGPVSVTGPLTDTQLRASAVPIIGTVTANLGTIGNAATETTLSTFSSKVPTGLTVKPASTPAVATDPALVVAISPNTAINATLTNSSIEISNDVGNPIPVSGTVASTQSGTWNVGVTSSVLPTGASTSALQTSGNASLASIDTKTPALGQALAGASVPVVLTAAQLSTLTPLNTVTVIQPTGTNLHTVIDNASIAVTGTFWQTTQPVSLTSTTITSSSLPTGASTATNQTTGNASLASIDSKLSSPISVTGPLTDAQLRATAVPVSLTSTTITSSALPTGAATSALQTTISGQLPATLGAKTTANSMAVNIASDQVVATKDVITTFRAGIISITTTPTLINVTGTNLVNRKFVSMQPLTGVVYQGSSNTITSAANSGIVFKNRVVVKSFSDGIGNWYAVTAAGSISVYVEEGS